MNKKLPLIALVLVSLGCQSPYTGISYMFPLPIRLNNPGSLRHAHDKWIGMTKYQDDKKFVRFIAPRDGIRAMMKTLLTYEDLYRLSSIELIIKRWAPPNENGTQYYIDDVSIRMGISQKHFIDLSDPDVLISLSKAIVIHENGHPPSDMPEYWYDEVIYHEAAMIALNEVDE